MAHEEPILLEGPGCMLLGILHVPEVAAGVTVLVTVGGPQYRIGSHRQFVLTARRLADEGFHVLRFDLPGMGDSGGDALEFTDSDESIGKVVEAIRAKLPGNRIVLYGLCDAASANLLAHPSIDAQSLHGLICVNPWVRREETVAKTRVRHYYRQRLASPDFWRRILRLDFDLRSSIADLFGALARSTSSRTPPPSFVDGMLEGLSSFGGPVLFILSEQDLTAQEFRVLVAGDSRWKALFRDERIAVRDVSGADHTFSDRTCLDLHDRICVDWLRRLVGTGVGR